MNCYPDAQKSALPAALDTPGNSCAGLDLTPYLNFLLDVNNPESPVPTPLQFPCKYSLAAFDAQSKPPNNARADHSRSRSVSNLAKDINTRLDRLESELSKIVKNVTGKKSQKTHGRASSASSSSTDEFEERARQSKCTYAARSASTQNGSNERRVSGACQTRHGNDTFRISAYGGKPSKVKLIPPECFESRRSIGDSALERRSSAHCAKGIITPEQNAAVSEPIKYESNTCARLELDLDQTKREMRGLRDELNSCRDARDTTKRRADKLEAQLADECTERRKLQRKLEDNISVISDLTFKLECLQSRERELGTVAQQKEKDKAALQELQRENSCLKEELQRLNKLSHCRRSSSLDADKQQHATRQAVDDALKKATAKFCRFHTDEIRSLENKLRTEQNRCQENTKLQQVTAEDQNELQQLRKNVSQLQSELLTVKTHEECFRNKCLHLECKVQQSDDVIQQKQQETDQLRCSVEMLRKECERIPQLKETIAVLHAEKCSLAIYKDTAEVLERKVRVLENEKEKLQSALDDVGREQTMLCAQLSGNEKDTRCQKEQDLLMLRLRDEEIDKQKTEIKSLSETIKIKDKILDDLQDTVMKMKKTFEMPPKTLSNPAETEHLKRRNRELEEVLERMEQRKNDLKEQLLATDCQLQDSLKAHHIVNAKLKERAACISKLQAAMDAQQARFEIREEELQHESDEVKRRAETLQSKLENTVSRSREQRSTEINRLKAKYETEMTQKDVTIRLYEQEISSLEGKLQAVQCALSVQKRPLSTKCNRLERMFSDFDCDV
ncbi:protein Daple-like [Paramacrobiotus metropolitanus]|uniref:protein Daple-like n=1 Tax=Paramacrobiotus metropolitanus TaxID=2943436 RepID=UPI0024456E6F|nr:protein Daple-like [Paramacrobiotus metropolitanus]XP_055328513.1 protein Daple-like [Paramacrobiotus metropolitanus]XP_055328514.1 protein Daple-like [Paramacrobiotus metropolitanus]XP_055328515.1 protein Daple-like [Paramacrobiotus metropolitanus]XP_055328516.1 protein Daple-like [Paramacrobiotus metropolitanus]